MCLKCKTITLGEFPIQCQNCGERFLDYQIMKQIQSQVIIRENMF